MVSVSNCHKIRHRSRDGGGGVRFLSPTVTRLDIEMGVGVWFLSPIVT